MYLFRVGCMSAAAKRYKYLRRLLQYHQMDFEFALWQMLYLFISPQKVYRNFYYRKRKENLITKKIGTYLLRYFIYQRCRFRCLV